ncbi:MAG: tetratricopeptide repeat protein [Thermoflexibacter sp.]|jgi:tetratricopeptide (TPR) repeat protein|nr:tetratricopeptide repeat protein [Thermoflexibacter sp.]
MKNIYLIILWVSVLWGISYQNINAQSANKEQIAELQVLDSLGQHYWNVSNYPLALSNYQKAFKIAQVAKDSTWLARILNYIGIMYENKGDFEKSLQNHFQALKIRENIKNQYGIGASYLNIGIAYSSSGQIEKGIEYYEKALEINKEIKNRRLEAHATYHLSTSFRRQKNYEKAFEYAQKALAIAEEIDETSIIKDSYNALGLLATQKQQFEQGRAFFQKACDLAEKEQVWLVLTNGLQHFADNYKQEKNYNKALKYAQKSLVLAKKHELKAEEENAYQMLAEIYAVQGNFGEAYLYFEKFNALKDTLFNLNKNKQILELTTEYESEKKEQQIRLDQVEIQRQQNITYSLIVFIMLLSFVIVAIIIAYRNRQRVLKQDILIQRQKEVLAKSEQKRAEALLQINIENQKREAELHQKELQYYTHNLVQKTELLEEMRQELEMLKNSSGKELNEHINALNQLFETTILTENDWEEFKKLFEQVYKGFFTTLKANFPDLSQAEIRLCSLIKLNLTTKEAANMLAISPESVNKARYRLRKKLNLLTEESLDELIVKI